MGTQSLSGDDTFTMTAANSTGGSISNVFNNVPHGDFAVLTYPNELVTVKIGKNQNALYAKNVQGDEADLVIRTIRGSYDDKWLNALIESQDLDFASFTTLSAVLAKRIGQGNGSAVQDKTSLRGGVFTKRIEARINVDGDVEQLIAIYSFKFTIPSRTLM